MLFLKIIISRKPWGNHKNNVYDLTHILAQAKDLRLRNHNTRIFRDITEI